MAISLQISYMNHFQTHLQCIQKFSSYIQRGLYEAGRTPQRIFTSKYSLQNSSYLKNSVVSFFYEEKREREDFHSFVEINLAFKTIVGSYQK